MDPSLPGLIQTRAYLLDERTRPDFRDVFGTLARRSSTVATAVTRVRLTTLDLSPEELSGIECFRVLLSEVSALRLDAEARALQTDARRAPNVELLQGLLESGRLEVRSAPLAGWSPDFTVFGSPQGPEAVLTGFHWFERPYPHRGPALASLHFGDPARRAARRHEEVWDRAHDVGSAIWSILSKARRIGALGALLAR